MDNYKSSLITISQSRKTSSVSISAVGLCIRNKHTSENTINFEHKRDAKTNLSVPQQLGAN